MKNGVITAARDPTNYRATGEEGGCCFMFYRTLDSYRLLALSQIQANEGVLRLNKHWDEKTSERKERTKRTEVS